MSNEDVFSTGELTATGKDKIEIPFHTHLKYATVMFADNNEHIFTCNPHIHDWVEADLIEHRRSLSDIKQGHHPKCTLVIRWHVTGSRQVIWSVFK